MDSDIKILVTPSEILCNVNAIVYLFDVESKKYIWSNGNYRNILNYKEINELSLNDFIKNYVHRDDINLIKERFDYLKEKKGFLWNGVFRIKHNRGHYIWLYSIVQTITEKPFLLLGVSIKINDESIPKRKFLKPVKDYIENLIYNSNSCNLTKREIEVIKLIAIGKTYKEIAAALSIQPDTVNKHRKHIFEKIDVHNTAALLTFCYKSRLL
jgi:DNA-binding CsgD family transcriptional regulator